MTLTPVEKKEGKLNKGNSESGTSVAYRAHQFFTIHASNTCSG